MAGSDHDTDALSVLKTALAIDIDATIPGASLDRTIAGIVSRTIAPTVNVRDTSGNRAHRMLSRAVENRNERLTLGEVLGEGGMGIVRNARQSDLGRDVAVKALRKEVGSSQATVSLLREAWVTGTLEHPNVVPVYYVDTDAEGKPLIVLKRIEGVVWSGLIANPAAVRLQHGSTDLLEWNLEVLEKVINAMRYSHRRGVIHRDLKPDNVMVGEFGEVYVVDWGIAVSLVDDGETLLPIASEVESAAGTPAFMAPEMLGGPVNEKTDIYLLGALLYQIIADRPPHIGTTLEEIVESIKRSEPVFPDDAPEALCAICRKAMARDPEDRYESAQALGQALRLFNEHRSSLRLSGRAQRFLARLRERVDAKADNEELMGLLGECRFGFQSSLEAWPENEDAQEGLREAIELVAELELRRGDPRVSASILRELDAPSESLLARVQSAIKALEQEEERKARLDQQLDRGFGKRTRVLLLALFGSAWIGLELWAQLTNNVDRYATHDSMILGSLISILALGAAVYRARTTLMQTLINRQLGGALFALLATQALLSSVASTIHMSPQQAQVLWILIWTAVATMVTVTIEKRMWPMSVGTAICFLIAARWMDHRIYAMMVATALMVINAAVLWWPESAQSED